MRLLIVSFAFASLFLGATVITGWYLHIDSLVQLRYGLVPMQFNAALCLVLCGLALSSWVAEGNSKTVTVLAAAMLVFSGLTLIEYIFGIDAGIDQILFRPYIIANIVHVGRMSPVSAICFTLAGITLLLLASRSADGWRAALAGSLASVIISISLVGLAGYIFGLSGAYGWGQLTKLAIHTAIGLCCVGGGLFAMVWIISLHPAERTPRWLPAPLALSIFTGSLVLYFALVAKQTDEVTQTVKFGAESAKNLIVVRMEARMRAFVRMAQRWDFGGHPARAVWEADATNYIHDFPDVQAIEWIDAARVARWVIPYAGNESKVGKNLTIDDRRTAAVNMAVKRDQAVITRIVTLFHGGLGFLVYVPVFADGKPDGYIAAVFNAQACLNRYLPPVVAPGERIEVFDGKQKFYGRDDVQSTASNPDWIGQQSVDLPGAIWTLKMWPSEALVGHLDSPLPAFVLVAGSLAGLLLAAVCYLAQVCSRHATDSDRTNVALKESNRNLQEAMNTVRTLEGLLPICSCCKSVRDDTGYWSQIDTYIGQHTNASLSHGYCPECAAKTFKEFGFDVPAEVEAEIAAGNYEKAAGGVSKVL